MFGLRVPYPDEPPAKSAPGLVDLFDLTGDGEKVCVDLDLTAMGASESQAIEVDGSCASDDGSESWTVLGLAVPALPKMVD